MDTRTTLRLTPDLHQRVKESAEKNHRSVHAELVLLIETSLDTTSDATALRDPGTKPVRSKSETGCPPHPRGRVIKGFCYRCGKPAT